MQDRSGLALVICAPSGTGKTTLTKRLRDLYPRLSFSISCTTRPPRPGEENGKDYHFISTQEFLLRKEQHFFAEWAEVYGNFYGTPLETVQKTLAAGNDILFDIDVQGALQLRETLPQAHFIFIFPPSIEELEKRLRGRGTETDESLDKRLKNAQQEIAQARWFNYWIVNEDLEQAWKDLQKVYLAAALTPTCKPHLIDQLLSQRSLLSEKGSKSCYCS